MALTEKEIATIDHYDRTAAEFQAFRGEGISHNWAAEIARFHQFLPTGKLLEIGCGTGNEGQLLADLGYDYQGTDPSIAMLRLALHQHPNLHFRLLNVLDLDFFPHHYFDGFVAFASLLHVAPENIQAALHQIKAVTAPGGIGLITLKQGEGEAVAADGRYFVYYTAESFSQELAQARFRLLDLTFHPEKNHDWLCFFVQNPDTRLRRL